MITCFYIIRTGFKKKGKFSFWKHAAQIFYFIICDFWKRFSAEFVHFSKSWEKRHWQTIRCKLRIEAALGLVKPVEDGISFKKNEERSAYEAQLFVLNLLKALNKLKLIKKFNFLCSIQLARGQRYQCREQKGMIPTNKIELNDFKMTLSIFV